MPFINLMLHLTLVAAYVSSNDAIAEQPRRDFFYVGGKYTNITTGKITAQYKVGQIYVERLTPPIVTQQHPLVFIAGAGQTGTNFLETPDGRPGWASFFLNQGYIVYLSDQASRGRSPWNPSVGSMMTTSTASVEEIFTATSNHNEWPQSKLHTQWPGTGVVGDPAFDAFYATQIQFMPETIIYETQNTEAYSALLDKIGAVHLVTHSQAGTYGWRIGDARPKLVQSIVALEPSGPPFEGKPPSLGNRPWGITVQEITYDPPAGPNATFLEKMAVPSKDADHYDCILQREPAKKLKSLVDIPVLVVTGEASFHAPYDYCTVEYLKQAGVDVEHVELAEEGIHGNGHMFFMEKNNFPIAERVLRWLRAL